MPKAKGKTTVRAAVEARRQIPRAAHGTVPARHYLQIPWWLMEALENGTQTLIRSTFFRWQQAENPHPAYSTILPCPVVCWAVHPSIPTIQRMRMMTVTDNYIQPIGMAAEQEIRMEGFADRAAWRTHWMDLKDSLFDPLELSEVYVVRDYEQADAQIVVERIIEEMYGPYLDGNSHDRHLPAPRPTTRRSGLRNRDSTIPARLSAPQVQDAQGAA